jgi:hypothetical protein
MRFEPPAIRLSCSQPKIIPRGFSIDIVCRCRGSIGLGTRFARQLPQLGLLWECFSNRAVSLSQFISMESVRFHEADGDCYAIQKLQAIDPLAMDSIPVLSFLFIRKIISA